MNPDPHSTTISPKPDRLCGWAFFLVRPAWAHTCGCKSRHELVTVSEVKRNCMKATECGEEAWIVNCEPMNKNRIEGHDVSGESAKGVLEWLRQHEIKILNVAGPRESKQPGIYRQTRELLNEVDASLT